MPSKIALPPVVQLLLSEFPNEDTHENLQRRFKDREFVRDVNNQALYSLAEFKYADDRNSSNAEFVVYASDSLNPLGEHGKCFIGDCWLDSALSFARLAGLYAD